VRENDSGEKEVVACFKVIFRSSYGGTDENNEKVSAHMTPGTRI
jgi:hypothetical protein